MPPEAEAVQVRLLPTLAVVLFAVTLLTLSGVAAAVTVTAPPASVAAPPAPSFTKTLKL